MTTLTIKLLHERRTRNLRRKVDGSSGMLYAFIWRDAHKAYCFTTQKQAEVNDLFESQGKAGCSYFAPVITIEEQPQPQPRSELKPLTDDTTILMIERTLTLPDGVDSDVVGRALVEAYDKGLAAAPAPVPVPAPVVAPTPPPAAVTAPEPATQARPAPSKTKPPKAA